MAAINYSGIRTQIKSILEGDAALAGTRIYIEEEPQFGLSDVQKAIAVFTDRRTAPPSEQSLAAGKRTRYYLRTLFVVLFFDTASFDAACTGRDDLLGALELVLMANRTLGGLVATSWLEGGAFYSGRTAQGYPFVSVAELDMTSEVSAINT